jgi:hypothetical protein
MAETLVKSVPATAAGLVLRSGSVFRDGVRVCGTVVVRLVVAFWASCWVLRERAPGGVGWSLVSGSGHQTAVPWVGWCVVAVGSGWSLFENCTVDASIFATHAPCGCVLC